MKISIITVCKNVEKSIERTILSVVEQTYNDIEYIIIDGKSTDKTLDVIKKYEDKIDVFVSENDSGIYEAMNKGIKHSSGDYLLFLNAGDYLTHYNVIKNISQKIEPSDEVVYGNILVLDPLSNFYKILRFPKITRNFFLMHTIPHQATFYSKKIFEKYLFDESFKIISDKLLNYNLFVNKIKFRYVDSMVSVFLLGGVSSDKKNYKLHNEELQRFFALSFSDYSDKKLKKMMRKVENPGFPFSKIYRLISKLYAEWTNEI